MAGGQSLPTGSVTFVFTDIQGSTKLVQELGPERWTGVLHTHYALLRDAWTGHGGIEMGTEGDAFFVVFADAADAVAACLEGQLALAGHDWEDAPVKVRIGMHTGEASVVGQDYIGLAVHEAARVGASAHGGQVIVSQATVEAVGDRLPSDGSWRDLGRHALKDINGGRSLFQLVHPGLEPAFPPPRTLSAVEHNVPTPPTPLVGRADELREATTLLLDEARLVTLTGPGGIGKTRLVLEVAYTLLAYQPGGVWFVPVAGVNEASGLLPAIAAVLHVREQAGADLTAALQRRLRGSRALLVLDNLEQVLDGVDVVADLLAALPDLRVLTTSRERLRLRGERVIAVPPLSTGDKGDGGDEAALLFSQRAKAVGEPVGVDDGASVERIVVALAGVPLAIELAAARLPDVGLGGLVKATDSLLDVLTEGERDLPVRQQTLRAALTWSHDLLNVEERRVFARLAVFAGGIPSEAVDAVCGEGSRPAVVELAAKSLVHLDGERLSMLEPIRQFAAEHLDAIGESQERGVAHAAWFRDLAEDADPALLGPTQGEWLHRLADLHDNFDAALRHGAGRPELELRLAAALARYWYVRGHWSEGRAALARALKGTGDPGTRANALVGAGALAIAQGDLDAADSLLTEARSDAATAGDALTGAKAANGRAEVARLRGDLDQAGTLLDEAEASAGDDVALAASIRINQGLVALGAGDLEGAATALDDAITRYTKMGNARGAGLATVNRGRIAHLLGDKEGAETRYRLALEELNRLGEQAGLAAALENLGVLLDDADEVDDRMPPILEQHLRVRRDLGDEPGEARALFQLGKLEFDLDHFESAIEWFDEAKAIVARQGNEAILAGVESLRSRCLAATGRPAEAVEAAAASALSFAAAGNVDAAGTMRSLADRYREEAAGAGAPTASS